MKFKIQELRKKSGITQVELAQKIGVSTRTIQSYEAGSIPPSDKLKSIAEALGTSLGELLFSDEENPIKKDKDEMYKKANEKTYLEMSDDEIGKLLENQGFNINTYKNLSIEDKEDFIKNLSYIDPEKLILQKYLDNFDNLTKQDLLDLLKEIKAHNKNVISTIIENQIEPMAKTIEFQGKMIDLYKSRVDELQKNIQEYNSIFSKLITGSSATPTNQTS